MIHTTCYDSPIGRFLLTARDGALTGLWIEGQKYFLGALKKEELTEGGDLQVLRDAKRWLDRYFAGEKPAIQELPLKPEGSDFRRQVWDILCRIPYGQVTTYREIAGEIAGSRGLDHMSSQAVGGAVGHNPISVIIPCHRVVGTDGSLTGYAGGMDRKIKLLELEGADMGRLFVPKKISR